MNSRTSSVSAPQTRAQRLPSLTHRLSFAVGSAEQGEAGEAASRGAAQQIDEEIEEIKRYEVCHIFCPDVT
jgi:chloride channel 3/4/5